MLHYDTKIALLSGEDKTIGQLAEDGKPVWTYSYDRQHDRIVPAIATPFPAPPGMTECVRITLDNDENVLCSSASWLARDGSFISDHCLSIGTSMMPLYRKIDKGYERVLAPKNMRWITTHWLVAHELSLRASPTDKTHLPQCGGCRLAVHHVDFNGRNNTPDNLRMMLECKHNDYHASLRTPEEWSAHFKRVWENDLTGMMRANSVAHISRYNQEIASGSRSLTEAQIEARRRNGRACGLTGVGAKASIAARTPETYEKIAQKARGRTVGPEWREKISLSLKARYAKGELPLTEAQAAARKTPPSAAAREAASKAHKGKPKTAEHRSKISSALKGRERSPEHAAKISAALTGRRRNHKIVMCEASQSFCGSGLFGLAVQRFDNFALSAGVFIMTSR